MKTVQTQMVIPRSFNPENFLGKGWYINERIHEIDLPIVPANEFAFLECVEQSEEWVPAREIPKRLKKKEGFICFGANFFLSLWLGYEVKREKSVLGNIPCESMGFVRESFFDPVSRSNYYLYLIKHGNGKWSWNINPVEGVWSKGHPVLGCWAI